MEDLPNPHAVPSVLMSGPDVPIEAKAIRQALALCALAPVERMVLTPDLHVGPEVPVGVAFDTRGALVPGAIGNDVGCGMRLAVFDDAIDLDEAAPGARLRAVFFEGARDLRLRPADRLAVLEHGLVALLDAPHVTGGEGGWAHAADDLADHVERTHRSGGIDAGGVDDALAAWARRTGERDSQLGSLGGGNHFCELQRVAEVVDGPTAWAWGLRPGALAVMVHAGSLGFGHVAAARGKTAAATAGASARGERGGAARPAAGAARGRAVLPDGPEQDAYVRALRNAANVAWANRFALTAMAVGAIADVLGTRPRWVTVGDAPHNLIWREGDRWRHRKGACPAEAPAAGPFAYTGEPVLIPGSMGDSSWVLAGTGAEAALCSTSHGAGRVLARGRAARTRDDAADARLRVVTPIDPTLARRDVRAEHDRRVREEAPRAYKPIGPVVDAVVAAGAARRVARLEPLLTVKG